MKDAFKFERPPVEISAAGVMRMISRQGYADCSSLYPEVVPYLLNQGKIAVVSKTNIWTRVKAAE